MSKQGSKQASKQSSGGGARQTPLVAGIDLGGTNMQHGIVDAEGRIVGRSKRKTRPELGRDGVIKRLREGLERACSDAGITLDEIAAVGVGAPGAIDFPRGVIYEAPNLGWRNEPIRDLLASAFGKPVVLDNDVNVAVWGEFNAGAGKGRGDMLGMWMGTGLGGGLVIGGRVFRGENFTAGELGQTIITLDGGPSRRTVEHHCSRSGVVNALEYLLKQRPDSLLHRLRREDGRLGSGEIAKAYHDGDETTVEVLEHAASLLGVAAANAATLLSLDTIVIGGGLGEELGPSFAKRVKKHFDRWVFPEWLRRAEVLSTALPGDAGVIGAALMARELAESEAS